MICPKCRNEKLDLDVCSQCGLTEREALLQAAQVSRRDGKLSPAINFYDKYLRLEPGDAEALRQKATCLYLHAVQRMEPTWFDQANQALKLILEKDWAWEAGHQHRIDLFSSFGRLEELEEEYRQVQTDDEPKQTACLNALKVIQLTKKFKEETFLSTESALDANALWLKKTWPLLLLPFVLWVMFEFSDFIRAKETDDYSWLFFVWILLGLLVILLFYIYMKLSRDSRKKK